MKVSDYLDHKRNYVVTKRRDNTPNWWFQVYQSRLNEYSSKGSFYVVAVCDAGSETECVIAMPYSFLQKEILPNAKREEKGRYLFDIDKATLRVNWRPRDLTCNGKIFLIQQ